MTQKASGYSVVDSCHNVRLQNFVMIFMHQDFNELHKAMNNSDQNRQFVVPQMQQQEFYREIFSWNSKNDNAKRSQVDKTSYGST